MKTTNKNKIVIVNAIDYNNNKPVKFTVEWKREEGGYGNGCYMAIFVNDNDEPHIYDCRYDTRFNTDEKVLRNLPELIMDNFTVYVGIEFEK